MKEITARPAEVDWEAEVDQDDEQIDRSKDQVIEIKVSDSQLFINRIF